METKLAEVKAWIKSVRDHDGEVGYIDVRAYVWKHWPDLSEAETDAIVEAV
jgi:hypothetical protein